MTNATDLGRRRDRYFEYLRAAPMRFGFDAEIADRALSVKDGVRNDIPPVEHWHRIIPTVRLLERLREKYGAVTIRSAYRSPAYNDAVGSDAPKSEHIENRALDFHCATGTPKAWANDLRQWRAFGDFTGGIGVYEHFVHVDTRGTIADWVG